MGWFRRIVGLYRKHRTLVWVLPSGGGLIAIMIAFHWITTEAEKPPPNTPEWITDKLAEEDSRKDSAHAWPRLAHDRLEWKSRITLRTGMEVVVRIVFSPDGKRLAVSGRKKNGLGECQFWETATGKLLDTVPASILKFERSMLEIVFSTSTRQYFLSNGSHGALVDADNHEIVRRFVNVQGMGDFSPNGKVLAVPYGPNITFYKLPDGADSDIPHIYLGNSSFSMKFASSDQLLIHFRGPGNAKEPMQIRRLGDRAYQGTLSSPPSVPLGFLRLSSDRKLAYIVSAISYNEVPIQLMDWRNDRTWATIEPAVEPIYSNVLTPDKKHMIVCDNGGRIHFWNTTTLEKDRSFLAVPNGVCYGSDISSNGLVLAAVFRTQESRWEVGLFDLKNPGTSFAP